MIPIPLLGTYSRFSQLAVEHKTVSTQNYSKVVGPKVPFLLSVRLKDCMPCETLKAAIPMIKSKISAGKGSVHIVDFEITDFIQVFQFNFGVFGFPSLYKIQNEEIVEGWVGLGEDENSVQLSDFIVDIGLIFS